MEIPPGPGMEPTMTGRSGQALVEAALVLPCLLVLLAGLFVSGRAVSLAGSAESAAMVQVLREGRRQSDIGGAIARSILPRGTGVDLRTDRKKVASLLPSVLPSPEGHTRCSVHIDKDWKEAGRTASWPALSTTRWIEGSIDCWDRTTPTGIEVAAAVRTYLVLRAIR